jgi:hypothetical protein
MSTSSDKSERPLTRDELHLLLKVVQLVESTYLIDEPQHAIEAMHRHIEKALVQYGSELAPDEETRERVYRLGVHVRQALGEELNDNGSPL